MSEYKADPAVKDAFTGIIEEIYAKQFGQIAKAAELAAQKIAAGGAFFVYDRGHVIGHELLCRSGGPVFVRYFDYRTPDAVMRAPECQTADFRKRGDPAEQAEFDRKYAKHFMVQNGFREGDVLLMNSVSGRAQVANDIAESAKELGVTIIAITSLDTIGKVKKGLKPYIEYVDVVIDNCVKYGDSLFDVEGIDERIIPPSGIAAAYIGWTMIKAICENLVKLGKSPSVFRSCNIEGGEEQNKACLERYKQLGY